MRIKPVTRVVGFLFAPILTLSAIDSRWNPMLAGASSVAVPAGTQITVRTIDKIKPKETKAGDTFQASVDEPVIVNGREIIPRGTPAQIRLYKEEGKTDDLGLRLYSLNVRGRTALVNSDWARVTPQKKGMGTGAKTAIGAGVGAAVGAIAGGGKGAAIGAGAGAGTGLIISKVKGRDTEVPPETRLTFTIRNTIRI
ncbi:MAG: hypothetical protein JOY54_07855 [Acidobacteriaceae bacterium]|nr:hypothetical protein [Acidobacteriaceae bacterium]